MKGLDAIVFIVSNVSIVEIMICCVLIAGWGLYSSPSSRAGPAYLFGRPKLCKRCDGMPVTGLGVPSSAETRSRASDWHHTEKKSKNWLPSGHVLAHRSLTIWENTKCVLSLKTTCKGWGSLQLYIPLLFRNSIPGRTTREPPACKRILW